MRHVIAVALVAAMTLHASLLVATAQANSSISGTVRASGGRPVANTSVRLRNVTTNQMSGTGSSNAAGQYQFAGLVPGTYVVEVVNAAGEIIGTSGAIVLSAGAEVTEVMVSAAAASASATAAGLSRAAIIGLVAAGGAVPAVIAVRATGSASR